MSGLLSRPLFWVAAMLVLFSVPLLKSLSGELPEPPPGWDTEPASFTLLDERGESVSLSDLRDYLVVVAELPLGNAPEREHAFDGLRAVRKRLRGMGHGVVFLSLCHGGPVSELTRLLDDKIARKPQNVFLMDDDRTEIDALRRMARAPSARFLVIDRHGRIRGAFGEEEAAVDQLVYTIGVLGNWPGSDPEPGQPIKS